MYYETFEKRATTSNCNLEEAGAFDRPDIFWTGALHDAILVKFFVCFCKSHNFPNDYVYLVFHVLLPLKALVLNLAEEVLLV